MDILSITDGEHTMKESNSVLLIKILEEIKDLQKERANVKKWYQTPFLQIIISIVGIGIAAIGFGYGVYRDLRTDINRIEENIGDVEVNLGKVEQNVEHNNTLLQNINQLLNNRYILPSSTRIPESTSVQ